MTASRVQHSVMALIVLALAGAVAWFSFTGEPVEAFLFPRIIAIAFVTLAIWNAARATLGLARVGEGVDAAITLRMLPGIVISVGFIFFAAKFLGFYASSTLAFVLVATFYDPAPLLSPRAWMKRIIVTAIFMAVIYGLFAGLLQVQTPRGLLF